MAETRSTLGMVVSAVVGATLLTVLVVAGRPAASTVFYAPAVQSQVAPVQPMSVISRPGQGTFMASNLANVIPAGSADVPTNYGATQTVTWRHLQWAFVTFVGAAVALNAFILSRINRGRISMAAVTGEQDEEMGLNRRQALFGASAAATLVATSPAYALFGFGEDANQAYKDETTKLLDQIKSVLVLDNNDPAKPDRVAELRRDMNAWVAKYRRDTRFSGRASYGNLYSVINAIAGHYTNFGAKTPIPKKRAAQIVNEIGAAEQLVGKGR